MAPVVKMILARDAGNGIGYGGKLPWEDDDELRKDDMRLFRRLTLGREGASNCVVMGYNTWESIPQSKRPLKGRTNIVMTNTHYSEMRTLAEKHDEDDLRVVCGWDDLVTHIASSLYDEIWIIGGAEIYRGAIENLDVKEIYRTTFKQKFLCDKYLDLEGLLCGVGFTFCVETMFETSDYVVELIRAGVGCDGSRPISQKEDCPLSDRHSKRLAPSCNQPADRCQSSVPPEGQT